MLCVCLERVRSRKTKAEQVTIGEHMFTRKQTSPFVWKNSTGILKGIYYFACIHSLRSTYADMSYGKGQEEVK